MARVLLTWELGGGLGHLASLLPLARGLRERGHRVFVALRDLSRAAKVFAGVDLSYLQAPIKTRAAGPRISPPRTFAHILHNIGFAEPKELWAMTEAWRNLYACVEPDLIVFDHSPTALLAARGWGAKRALIGTGFCCPLDGYPLPDLRPWLGDDLAQLRGDEDRVLDHANRILNSYGEVGLERLSQLYHEVDENFLMTFKELDHYPSRKDAQYWGACPNIGGKIPVWPEGQGKRIFAYLSAKPFPGMPRLLTLLSELRFPTVICGDGINAKLKKRFQSATLRFENERLDLHQVSSQCELAILNGTHGTTVSMLLAGRPILQLPVFLEQALTSVAVTRLGAGLSVPLANPERIAGQLSALVNSEVYAEAARRFATQYVDFVPERQIKKMIQRCQEHLN